ncbi:hypothetical protein QAD02_024324 [Eretmocerus hayati]|uniref:Uncharacterized protein n=1 Tax=Eretmocerus hayati TaxID=131215 RepID=A0ACC2PZ33_9HYME|nr:hypothetical protein QAD02_024324 [Eretmocerus hayati]
MPLLINFVFVTILLISEVQRGVPVSVSEYLGIKQNETKDVLFESYQSNAKNSITDTENRDFSGIWTKLWNMTSKTTQPWPVIFSDQIFLLGNRATHPILHSDINNHEPIELHLLRDKEPLKFTKSFSRGQSSFLLLCYEKYCFHYESMDVSQFDNQKSIQSGDSSPIDAVYFARDDQVFLLVTYSLCKTQSSNQSVTKLYRWTGFSMVFVSEIKSPRVKSIAIIQNGNTTTLLLVLKDYSLDRRLPNTNALVYELNDEDYAMRPVSSFNFGDQFMYIHPFLFNGNEFVLVVGDRNFEGIFWWDGAEFKKVCTVPGIESQSSADVARINNETLLFIKNLNSLNIYRITTGGAYKLDDLSLKIEDNTVNFSVCASNGSILLVLVKQSADGTFGAEHWQLNLLPNHSDVVAFDDVSKCFDELQELLDLNMPMIQNLINVNSSSESDNAINESSLPVREIRNGENISLSEIKDELYWIRDYAHIEHKLSSIEHTLEKIISRLGKIIDNEINHFAGQIVIDGDVFLQELNVDHLSAEYLNQDRIDFENLLVPGLDQSFTETLRAKSIFIDDLEIRSLCGLDSKYWYQIDDVDKVKFKDLQMNGRVTENETVVVHDDLILPDLKTEFINGVNLRGFLNDLFIIGGNQTITGNVTYEKLARIMNLTTETVNNVPASLLLTKHSNQTLGDVFIDDLDVKNLIVDKINGVPINQAARMSQANVIKGRVNIAHLMITDELIVDESLALPLAYPTQVYDEVVIDGDVFIKNLMMENDASMQFSYANLTPRDIENIVDNSWSKSRDQTIKEPVILEQGISIDELNCTFVNGLTEHDYLYTNSYEMVGLENVTFGHFHFHGVMNNGSRVADRFFEETPHSLIFHKAIRMTRLSVDNLFSDRYNGIPIDTIMQGDNSIKFHGISEFDTLEVSHEMIVDDLHISQLNDRIVGQLDKILYSNQNLRVDSLKVKDMSIRNLYTKALNGKDLERALLLHLQMSNQTDSLNLTIRGNLEIEASLQVDKINEIDASDFVNQLKNTTLVNLIETGKIKNLHIKENMNVSLLNGRTVENYFVKALSKTKAQTITGELFVTDAQIKNLQTQTINKKNVSSLLSINESCTFEGNVSFSDLNVEGNIIARSLNGRSVSEVQENLKTITLKNGENLQVFGNVSWHKPSKSRDSLSYLLNNAVTRHEDQIIKTELTFRNPVLIETLNVEENSPLVREVSAIVSDTVIDDLDVHSLFVSGKKIFKKGLTIDNLEVANNLDVEFINGVNVEVVVSQIYQKYGNDRISSKITFDGPVVINNLVTSEKIHGVSVEHLAKVDGRLPEKLHFRDLTVENDVTLHRLDGVNFDEFKNSRINIHEDYEIFGDVEFDESVVVLNGSSLSYINGINPQNLVISGNTNNTTSIYGNKVFLSNVTVYGDFETSLVNDIDLKSEYNNSVLASQTAEIFGDLIFEGDVKNLYALNFSGPVNGLDIQQIFSDTSNPVKDKYDSIMNSINEKENQIESYIARSMSLSSLSTKDSPVMYLEEDDSLDLHIPGVHSVRGMAIELATRLYVYSAEFGDFCGVSIDCPCKRQYTIDFPFNGTRSIHRGFGVKFEFFTPNGLQGVRVVHKAASQNCESERSIGDERSELHWIGFGNQTENQKPAAVVNGYIADAQAFMIGNKLYLVLAIFYDRVTQTHATDSLVYEFDFYSREVTLVQSITTDGAKSLHTFQTRHKGLHLLIGCVKGRAESLLLRFDYETRMFQNLRTFATGGSRHVSSADVGDESFVILNNADVDVLQIFGYESKFDNYYHYQNLPFKSRVTSLSVFYSGAVGQSNAFVAATTRDSWFYIFEYMYFGKFQLKISHWVEEIQTLTPFRLRDHNYLFVGQKSNSTILKLVQQK